MATGLHTCIVQVTASLQNTATSLMTVAVNHLAGECNTQRLGHQLSPSVVDATGQVLRTFEEALLVSICGCLAGDDS